MTNRAIARLKWEWTLMQFGLKDIDPQIAAAMLERLCAPPAQFLLDNIHWGGLMPFRMEFGGGGPKMKRKRDPSTEEKYAFELRKQRENDLALRAVTATFGPVFAGVGIGWLLAATTQLPMLAQTCALSAWIAGTVAGGFWTVSAYPKSRLSRHVRLEEMRAVFPLLSLTRAERIYCDTLLLMARMDVGAETEKTLRESLVQINRLMESARHLEQRRLGLLPLLGNNVIAELEAEFGSLGRRLDQTRDVISRQSLEQSLQMCQTRLENARLLQEGLERLNVQQEAILHTISTAQTAMARLQLAPQPQTELVAHEIAETVTQMNQQTYAVEQAVQEVMTLGVNR